MNEPEYREHRFVEKIDGVKTVVDLDKLKAERVSDESYSTIHRNTVIATHDAVITYNDGIVLMERIGKPLQGFIWLPGGRMLRGIPTEESLAKAVKRECGLDIDNFEYAGTERAFMPVDPLGHGHGADTVGPIFYVKGYGNLMTDVDKKHNHPLLVTPDRYAGIRESLHPFVQKYTDTAIGRIATARMGNKK